MGDAAKRAPLKDGNLEAIALDLEEGPQEDSPLVPKIIKKLREAADLRVLMNDEAAVQAPAADDTPGDEAEA